MTPQEKIADFRQHILHTEGRLQQLKYDHNRLRSIWEQLNLQLEANCKTAVSLELEIESFEKAILELEAE